MARSGWYSSLVLAWRDWVVLSDDIFSREFTYEIKNDIFTGCYFHTKMLFSQ